MDRRRSGTDHTNRRRLGTDHTNRRRFSGPALSRVLVLLLLPGVQGPVAGVAPTGQALYSIVRVSPRYIRSAAGSGGGGRWVGGIHTTNIPPYHNKKSWGAEAPQSILFEWMNFACLLVFQTDKDHVLAVI
jgi:hypothetical protein